jgi:hypothetical protein
MREGDCLGAGRWGSDICVLCHSIAPRYAKSRDDFCAVMVLPERTKPAGGKVDEGHRGASGARVELGGARRGLEQQEGGRAGPRAQRATWSQHKQTSARPAGQDNESRATALQGHSHGRATGPLQAQQDAPPPHPSPPHPFAGGHTVILKYPHLKYYEQKLNQRTRYHPLNPVGFCQKSTPLFVAGSLCYLVGGGVYPPRLRSFRLPPTPYSRDVTPSQIFLAIYVSGSKPDSSVSHNCA